MPVQPASQPATERASPTWQESFDFLGYTFGVTWRHGGAESWGIDYRGQSCSTTGDLPLTQIEHRARMEQKIHPQDPVDLKTIFHRPHFDLEALHLETPKDQSLDSLGEDELCTAYPSNATNQRRSLMSSSWRSVSNT